METQYVEQKGELLLEYKGKTTTLTVRDFTPAGARIEINEQGEMKGRYNANHLETVTVLIKPDGTSEWEAKESKPQGTATRSSSPQRVRREPSVQAPSDTKETSASRLLHRSFPGSTLPRARLRERTTMLTANR